MSNFNVGDKLIYRSQFYTDTEPSQEVIRVSSDGYSVLLKPIGADGVTAWRSQECAKRTYFKAPS
jgi:hypothetical protein